MMKRLLLTVLLCMPPCSLLAATPAIVGTPVGVGNTSSGNTSTSGSGSYTIATSGDDLIILLSAEKTATFSLSSITTSSGTITTDLAFSTAVVGSIYMGTGIYRIHNASATSYTITVTWSTSTSRWGMILAEGSGIAAVDGTPPAQNSGSGTAVSTGSTGASGDLLVAIVGDSTGSSTVTISWTSPFSSFANYGEGSFGMNISGASYATAAAASAAATLSASQPWAASIIAYSGGSSSCTHAGYTSGGITAVPNGTSGSYWLKNGTFGTPNCSTVNYWQPTTLGSFGAN